MSRERQTPPIVTPMSDSAELSGFGAQKRVFVRFGSSPIHQSYETILSLVIHGIFLKQDSVTQSLTTAVDTLVNEAEDQLLDSLTGNDYKRLVESSNKIASVIGENENNFLAPLMDFIDNLIKKHEEEPNMTGLRLPGRGLRSAYNTDEPEYTSDQLDLIKSQYQNATQDTPLIQLTGSRPPGRGLRSAYNTDEPEYTPDQLDLIKSQYQDPAER